MTKPPPTERDTVEKLAEEFMASYRAGACPSLEQYSVQFPDLADELRGLLATMAILEQNLPPPRATAGCDEMLVHDAPPREIGDFLIVREIGRGGMGIVYEAQQQSLGRQVALKVLCLPGLLHAGHLERFRREAQAAARLQHNHIVPVFGFGAHDGLHYYAMQYIAGQSLDVVIASLRQSRGTANGAIAASVPESHGAPVGVAGETNRASLRDTDLSTSAGRRRFCRDVARIGLQAAQALAYAHSEGILHRDIKPSNLLLDAKGNIWITDFGLAKTDGADELTQTGDFVGTLRYSAPERLEGWSDRRSDIYGLGVTLYELLTLEPFFANTSRAELLRAIADDTPVPPRKITDSIPVDLETVILKAVAKEPAARYHHAEEMAEDLRRFLADQPIFARRSTPLERLGHWCRRNPAIALLGTAVVGLLIATVVILALSNAQIRRESAAKETALENLKAALNEKDEALGKVWLYRGLYEMDGEQEKTLGDFDRARQFDPDNPDILWLRGFTLGGWGRYDEAIADMTEARPQLGDSKLIAPADRDWFVAMAYVAREDWAAYQAECRAALRKIRTEPNLEARGTLLWLCTVTPRALDDPSQLAKVVDAVLPSDERESSSDRLLDVGAAEYRAGNFTAARKRLEQSLQQIAAGKPTVDPNSETFANLFLAMAYSRLALPGEADAKLAEAERLAQVIKPLCWVDSLQRKLLTAEARAVTGTDTALSRQP